MEYARERPSHERGTDELVVENIAGTWQIARRHEECEPAVGAEGASPANRVACGRLGGLALA